MDSDSKIYYCYATMLPPSLEVHVRCTSVKKPGRFYGKDERGEIGATAKLAGQAREEGTHLSLFLLEERPFESDVDAYHRCIAWQRLFSEAGYALLSDADRRHVERMSEAELAHYEALCDRDVTALCAPERDLTPDILAARRAPRDDEHPHTVRVLIAPELYDVLTKRARTQGKKLPQYLLDCAMDAPAVGPDLSIITGYHRDLCRYLTLLRGYARWAERAGAHSPVAVKLLVETSRRVCSGMAEVTRLLTELAHR